SLAPARVLFFPYGQFGSPFLGAHPLIAANWQFLQRIQKAPAIRFIPIQKVPHSLLTSFSSRFLFSWARHLRLSSCCSPPSPGPLRDPLPSTEQPHLHRVRVDLH